MRLKDRRAITEVFGALIMVAVTVVAGAAVFGFVNGQAAVSENTYGQSVANGVQYAREHFSLVSTQFTGTGASNVCTGVPDVCTSASIWVYNTGQVTLTLASIQIKSTSPCSSNCLNVIFTSSGYSAYNTAGTQIACPNTPGFSPSSQTIAIGTMGTSGSSTPFTISIPYSCVGVNKIYVGQSYVLTLTGIYGNSVTSQMTASG